MTREEAIEIYQSIFDDGYKNGYAQARFDYGVKEIIREIKQEPTEETEQEPIPTTNNDEPITIIYPTIVCDDAVSREAVLNGLRGCICDEWVKTLFATMVKQLPSVNPQYTGNEFFNFDAPIVKKSMEQDAISREDALKLIYDFKENHTEDREKYPINYGTLLDLIRLIRELPSVTHKSGEWITKPHVYGVTYCSECDFELKIDDTNYCPNCGAKMVKTQERSDKE